MSCVMRSYTTGEVFHRSNPWKWILIDAAFVIGMVVRDEEGRLSSRRCPAGEGYICECDPGLPGICLTKFTWRGHGDPYVVTPREVRAALDAYDAWDGDLASIIVRWPNDRVVGGSYRLDDLVEAAPLGMEGAQDFLAFVRFLRSSAPDGFFVEN